MDFGISSYIQNNSSIVLDNLETKNQVISSGSINSDTGIAIISGLTSDTTITLPNIVGLNAKKILIHNSENTFKVVIQAYSGNTIDGATNYTFDHDIGSITLIGDEPNLNWVIIDSSDVKIDNNTYNNHPLNATDQIWYKGTVDSHITWNLIRQARIIYPLTDISYIPNFDDNFNDTSRKYFVFPNNIIPTVMQRGEYDGVVLWGANVDFKNGKLVSTKEWGENNYRGLAATFDGYQFQIYKSDKANNDPIDQEVMKITTGTTRAVYFRGINYASTNDIVNNKFVGVRESDGKLVKFDHFSHLASGQLNLAVMNNTNGEWYDAPNLAYSVDYDSIRWNGLSDKNQFSLANDENDPPVYLLGVDSNNAFIRINDIYSSSSGGVSIMMADDGRLFKNSSSVRYKRDLSKFKVNDNLVKIPILKYRYKNEKIPEPELEDSYWSLAPTVESLVDNGLELLVNYKWIEKSTLDPQYIKKYSIAKKDFEETIEEIVVPKIKPSKINIINNTNDSKSEHIDPRIAEKYEKDETNIEQSTNDEEYIKKKTIKVTKCLVPDSINYNNYIGYINAQTNRMAKQIKQLASTVVANRKSIEKLKAEIKKLVKKN
jgi:hypothetical protein